MWGKDNKPENTPHQPAANPSQPAPRPQNPVAQTHHKPAPAVSSGGASMGGGAVMGKTTRLKGDIYSEEELFVDGQVEGTLEVRARLTIGPNGKVKANIKAREIIVRGSVQGDVEALDRISIMNGASIVGDVRTAGIVIEDGAYFKGGIDIIRPEVTKKQPEAAPAPKAAQQPQAQGAASR
jgi:cytoskeletal protein CcmA (bactofilin family)